VSNQQYFPSSFISIPISSIQYASQILPFDPYIVDPGYDYLVALVIGSGITLFLTSTENLELGYDVHGQASSSWTGVLLLILYLLFDSFTSQWQSRMFRRHRNLSLIELMLVTSAFSTALSFVTLMHTKELYPAISFINSHPEIQIHFFAYSLCSTIGQVFIFYTIKNFGAVIFALIMTARILTSIAISCILYGHQITTIGFVGLLLVMLAVLYRIKRQAHGQKLLRWQGMENDDGKIRELVHEWHEHADM
jgi:solute carrier family 35 (adenosine 3'-phospho 5'-phosphosulfate transporter), member B2